MYEWLEAIFIIAIILYACWKFTTFGLSGNFKRLFSRNKKKSDVNSGAKFG